MTINSLARFHQLSAHGEKSLSADVDVLMTVLVEDDLLSTTKLVDYALGLVYSPDGRTRIQHYLFHGTLKQRNYAALYFKRREESETLDAAVALGLIDEIQAYSS